MKAIKDRIARFKALMGNYVSEEFTLWLIDNGFFTAPASTKYHGNYSGGLYDHSEAVTKALVGLTESLGLNWGEKRSPYIVGMFHDLCKYDQYVQKNGAWEYNYDTPLAGHGDKSVILLSNHFQLTEEESLCVRYHMGAFSPMEEWDAYGKAIEQYPTVLYTHTADMIAARIAGI